MAFRHDKHRNVAIRHAVANRPKKANHFDTFNSHKNALRAGKKLPEFLGVGDTAFPAGSLEEVACGFNF